MSRTDIISHWSGTISFAVISTPRRLRLSEDYASTPKASGQMYWQYVEVDNRGNRAPTIFYNFNGRTASSALSTFIGEGTAWGSWRLPPDSIDRVFVKATSISVVASAATTIFLNLGRF